MGNVGTEFFAILGDLARVNFQLIHMVVARLGHLWGLAGRADEQATE